jgi:hypothetical protein
VGEKGEQMKPLSVMLGVILVGLTFIANAEVPGVDWKLFKASEDAKFYYDKKDVTYLAPKLVKVWIRQVYTKKGRTDMVKLLGPRYKNLSYSVNSLEFNCDAKSMRYLSLTFYSKSHNALDLGEPPAGWDPIRSDSMFDALYKIVCK